MFDLNNSGIKIYGYARDLSKAAEKLDSDEEWDLLQEEVQRQAIAMKEAKEKADSTPPTTPADTEAAEKVEPVPPATPEVAPAVQAPRSLSS